MNKRIAYGLFDKWVAVLGALVAFAIIPQALTIWTTQDSGSVSLLTWLLFSLWSSTMLIYGFIHRLWPIVISYSIGTALDYLVVIGIVIY